MFCNFCEMNISGTPCQTQSQSSNCPNNRGRETEDWDDRISFAKPDVEFIQDPESLGWTACCGIFITQADTYEAVQARMKSLLDGGRDQFSR